MGRPERQALFGISPVGQKMPLYFSLNGFTEPAIKWADRDDMAPFDLNLEGPPEALNAEARRYPCDCSRSPQRRVKKFPTQ